MFELPRKVKIWCWVEGEPVQVEKIPIKGQLIPKFYVFYRDKLCEVPNVWLFALGHLKTCYKCQYLNDLTNEEVSMMVREFEKLLKLNFWEGVADDEERLWRRLVLDFNIKIPEEVDT